MSERVEQLRLPRASLADGAYAEIRSRVLDGRIPPGARVTVRPIADELGLSATPIKAALVKLEREGLLASELHRGFFVPNLSDGDMREIFELREALDGMAADRAADKSCADEQIAHLGRLCDAQELNLVKREIDKYRELDVAFHRALWVASGNSRIVRAGEPLLDQMLLSNALSARQPGRGEQSLREHRAIVDAIGRGRPQKAAELARDHIRQSQRSFMVAVQK